MNFSKTEDVKIIVLGAGGTGGYIIPHLYRIGFAAQFDVRIIICDGDIVEEKNLIRQNFIEQDIGQNKAKVLAERYSAALGINAEYLPYFIEKEEELLTLVTPDYSKRKYLNNTITTQRVILIGAVDNNRSRQICNSVFQKIPRIIYIDSGNGESSGQVVCGIKQKNRTVYKPVCSAYPDMLCDEDKFPSELSCAERNQSAPQSIAANLTAATIVVSMLYNILICGQMNTRSVTFSSKLMNMRPYTAKRSALKNVIPISNPQPSESIVESRTVNSTASIVAGGEQLEAG